MDASSSQLDSIVAIDIGTVYTKAALIARVEGAYRFIARAESVTTAEAPWSDVAVGARHALEKLSSAAGRRLLNERGDLTTPQQPDGSGVDACVVTASAGKPLSVVLAGLAGEWSLESLRHAAMGTYTTLAAEIALSGGSRRAGRSIADDRIQRIYDARPDVVCISGGTDGGAERPVLELVEAAKFAARFLEVAGSRPRILFAGNARLKPRVAETVGDAADFLQIDNVRPGLDVENVGPLQVELETMYTTHKMGRIAGLATISAWSKRSIMLPTARAFGHVAQYLSAENRKTGVLGVDVGGSTTTVAAAFGGQLYTTLRSDVGASFVARFVEEIGWESVARWLDFEVSEGDIRAFAANKELRPGTIPQDTSELRIEQALAREVIRATLRAARGAWPHGTSIPRFSDSHVPLFEPIIGAGGMLARAPRPGQAALLMLDAIEPVGVTTLVLDVYGLAAALGAAALAEPLIAVQALEQGALMHLATVVAPLGAMRARAGEVVMNVRLSYESGGTIEDDIKAGSLSVLPLSPGQKAVMQLRPRVGIDIGRGPGRGGKPTEITGSALGLIVDARGRPLGVSPDPKRRRDQIKSWLWDVGA
ncbi:MAG TPA: glutamate mutase L [Anaerolineae bacterium]|nr:glutamate mutase L [Anaerolineae bacterium]